MPGCLRPACFNPAVRAVVQRVSRASVTVTGQVVGSIGPGLLVLVGTTHGDGPGDAQALAEKLSGLRIFRDDEDRMNLSVADIGGGILVVSQFTLYADSRRGRRPSFVDAGEPDEARRLVEALVQGLAARGIHVESGQFGEMMEVALVNDGPVTIILETAGGRIV